MIYALTLTINFRKKPYNLASSDKEIHKYIETRLHKNRSWQKIQYYILPEYDNNGRLHYHGVVIGCFQAQMSNCVRFWRNNMGFVNRDWSKDVKYPICDKPINEECEYIHMVDKPRMCWLHYVLKSNMRTGLWPIHNKII
jgi:hypothetical protein